MIVLKCPVCGAPVPPSKTRPRKFCSTKCRTEAWRRDNAPTKLAAKSIKQMLIDRAIAKKDIQSSLAKRDADYAASPYAARVTVEERGGVRIETRGQRCIGWYSSCSVKHI